MQAQTAACKDTAEHRRLAETMWEATAGNDPNKVYKAAQAFQKHADEEGDLEGHYNAWMCGVAYNLDRMNILDAYHIAVSLKNDLKNITGGEEEQYLGPCMMGQVYNVCGNEPGAIKEFEEAIQLIKGTRYEETTLHSLYLALAHLTLNSKPDQSLKWLDECIKVLTAHPESSVYHRGLAGAYACKSIIYFKKHDYANYRHWYEQAEDICHGESNSYASVFISYARIYKQAVDGHISEALVSADSIKSLKERYLMKCDLYLYSGEKDQAFNTQRQLMLLNDSIAGKMMAENVGQMEQEIQLMRSRQDATRRANIVLTVAFILAVLFLVLMHYFLYARRRYNKRLKEKNLELEAAYQHVKAADDMKIDFIRNVSHEIRTPLNIINGFTQVLTDKENTFAPEERQTIASTISENTLHITSLVNKMLALANESSQDLLSKAEDTDALDICQKAIQSMPQVDSNKIKVELDNQTKPGQAMLFTNGDSLLQMLQNMLENAVKFTEKGYIRLTLANDGTHLNFTVEDTGCGIPEDKIANIFDRFVKVDEFKEGLGLGLAYCSETTQKLGGSLRIGHTSPEGTSFILSLPIKSNINK